jgi:hypothetical protein
MIAPNPDTELTELVRAAQDNEPRLRDLRWVARKRLVRTVRDKTLELIDVGYTDPDTLGDMVESHCRLDLADDGDGDFGNPILFALIAAVVHWLVLRILDRLFPDRKHEFVTFGKGGR